MAKTKQSLLLVSAFCRIAAKATMLIEVRRGKKKKKLSRFARKIWRPERELPFCKPVGGVGTEN